jgi:hypothetical protein
MILYLSDMPVLFTQMYEKVACVCIADAKLAIAELLLARTYSP